MKIPVAQALFNSHSYLEYKKIVTDLLVDKKSTGNQQSDDLTHYSELNVIRMNRLDKTMQIIPQVSQQLRALKREYIWLVLTEGWCGDAAQIIPILNKMVVEAGTIDLKMVFRDENEELMNSFLTKHAKSIPIVIIVCKETGGVLGNWGSRPQAAVQLVANYKKQFGVIDDQLKTNLQLWYLQDKGESTQNELANLMIQIDK